MCFTGPMSTTGNVARGVRARAREEMRQAILAAARVRLATDGALGLSLRAVARDVGLASSAVYRYFSSRDELLTALIIEAYDSLGALRGLAERVVRLDDERGQQLVSAREVAVHGRRREADVARDRSQAQAERAIRRQADPRGSEDRLPHLLTRPRSDPARDVSSGAHGASEAHERALVTFASGALDRDSQLRHPAFQEHRSRSRTPLTGSRTEDQS